MPVLLQNQVSLTLKEFLEAGTLLVPLLNVHLSNTAWNKQGISPFLQCTIEHTNKKAGGFTLQISNSLNNSGMHVYPGRIEPYSLSVRNYSPPSISTALAGKWFAMEPEQSTWDVVPATTLLPTSTQDGRENSLERKLHNKVQSHEQLKKQKWRAELQRLQT